MQTIWKFPINVTDEQQINVPKGARFLTAQFQHGNLCLWAQVDDSAFTERRTIRVIGTGHPIPDAASLQYIASVQTMGGNLVFHVFIKE